MGYKKFLFYFLGIMLFFVMMIAGLLFYLHKIYEHNSYEEIVERQIEKNSIYGSALNENYFKYRLAMVKRMQPEILVVGSSRAGQFRQKYFNTSFLTTANGSNTLKEMEYFVSEVLKIYHPKLIIFVIDPWDFNPNYQNYQRAKYQEISGTDIGYEKLFLALKYFVQGKMPLINIFKTSKITNPLTGQDSLGIRSIVLGDGSYADGSYASSSIIFKAQGAKDKKFSRSIELVQKGVYFFSWSSYIDNKRLEDFESMIEKLKEINITTVSIVVPLAPFVYNKIMDQYKSKYTYIRELKNKAKNLYFVLNPGLIGSSNCEFIDGFHPGDVTIARVLKEVGKKDAVLRKYLNQKEIDLAIKEYSGNAYSGKRPKGMSEVDFLELGCKKH